MTTYARPAPTPRLSERGPWWGQALISAGGLAFLMILVVIRWWIVTYVLSEGGYFYDNYQLWSWGLWGARWIEVLVYAVLVAVWARTTMRAIFAPLAVFVLLGLRMILEALLILDAIPFEAWRFFSWALAALSMWGFVLGWTISRRRTVFTWIGMLPFLALTAGWVWLTTTGSTLAFGYLLFHLIFFIVSVLVFWACDGLGMLIGGQRTNTSGSMPVHTPGSPHGIGAVGAHSPTLPGAPFSPGTPFSPETPFSPGIPHNSVPPTAAYPPHHRGQSQNHEQAQPAPDAGQTPVEDQRQPDQR